MISQTDGSVCRRAQEDASLFALDNEKNINILGLCVGLPAACVAAVARDIRHVVELAIGTLGVVVRFGAALYRRSRLIEQYSGGWASTMFGSQQAIEQQLQEVNLPLPFSRRAYAGVISESWTTIFAPRSTKSLLASSHIPMSSPAYATASCVHASHLTPIDLEGVLGTHSMFQAPVLRSFLYSTSSLAPFLARNFKELLALALRDISEEPLLLDKTVQALSKSMSCNGKAVLVPVGPTVHALVVKGMLEKDHPDVKVLTAEELFIQESEDDLQDGIAIVSMSGRFSGAENVSDFWRLLQAGRTTHSSIPPTRFSPHETALRSLSGCFLSNPGLFDHEFFRMSPSESMQVDPIQRMLLMVVYEALQMAGYVPNQSPSTRSERIATFIGQTTSDW